MRKDYEELYDILQDRGIKTVEDLKENHFIYNERYPDENDKWVKELYMFLENMITNLSQTYEKNNQNYFVTQNFNMENIKYMCFFPDSSVILTKDFKSELVHDGNYAYNIPLDFLWKIIYYKDFIQEDVFQILPRGIDRSGGCACCGAPHIFRSLGGEFDYGYALQKIKLTGENGIFIDQSMLYDLFFYFPWLSGARVGDYIEIVNKNKKLFDKYKLEVCRILKEQEYGNIEEICRYIKYAHTEIQIEFEKAQQMLFRKGVFTTIGLICVFLPVFKDIPIEIKETIGTFQLKDMVSSLYNEMLYRPNKPYAFSWEWGKDCIIEREKNKLIRWKV